jgi:hypothetical protein
MSIAKMSDGQNVSWPNGYWPKDVDPSVIIVIVNWRTVSKKKNDKEKKMTLDQEQDFLPKMLISS